MRAVAVYRSVRVVGLIAGLGILVSCGSVSGQAIIRPPAPRVVNLGPKPAKPRTVHPGSTVVIPIGPTRPVVTYGPPRILGYSASDAYGSAAYGAYDATTLWGQRHYAPSFGGNATSEVLYGTYGFPSYGYNNYQGGSLGDAGILAPGLTIGVSNLGFGPWTYVGPVY